MHMGGTVGEQVEDIALAVAHRGEDGGVREAAGGSFAGFEPAG